jgi:hypothetical protein
VNYLNLRKNMKKALLSQLCHSEVELWQHCDGVESVGRHRSFANYNHS